MVSLASVSDAVNVWKYENSRLELTSSFISSTGTCNCLAWNHTNQVVATGGENHQIHLIQANNGSILSSLQVSPDGGAKVATNAIALSSNSRYLAAGTSNSIQLWDLKRRQIKTILTDHRGSVSALCFLHSGEVFSGDTAGGVRIWDAKSFQSSPELIMPSGTLSVAQVTSLSVSPSGSSALAVGYSEGTLRVWDSASCTLLRTQLCHSGSLNALAYSPRNPRLVTTAGADGRVTLIDTGAKNTTDASAVIEIPGVSATAVSFHEDAIHTAIGLSNGRILVYDWRNLRKPVVSTAPRDMCPILSLAFQVPKTSASGGNSVAGSAASSRQLRPAPAQSNSVAVEAVSAAAPPASAVTDVPIKAPTASAAAATPPRVVYATKVPSTGPSSSLPSPPPAVIETETAAAAAVTVPSSSSSSSLPRHRQQSGGQSGPVSAVEDPVERGAGTTPLRTPSKYAAVASAAAPASASRLEVGGSLPQASAEKTRSSLRRTQQLGSEHTALSSRNLEVSFDTSIPAAGTAGEPGSASKAAARYTSMSSLPATDAPTAASAGNNSSASGGGSGGGSARKAAQMHQQFATEWNQHADASSYVGSSSETANKQYEEGWARQRPSNCRVSAAQQQQRNRVTVNDSFDYDGDHGLDESFATVRQAVRPVSARELEDALALLKYDVHREVQDVIREQIRQFSIAKEETAALLQGMGVQVAELLAANRELRAENERLRRIY